MGRSCSRRRVPPFPLARARVVKPGDAVMPGTQAGQRTSGPKGQRTALRQPSRVDQPRVCSLPCGGASRLAPIVDEAATGTSEMNQPISPNTFGGCVFSPVLRSDCVRGFPFGASAGSAPPTSVPVRGKEAIKAIKNAWRRADTRDAAPPQRRAAAVARRCSQRRAGEGADRLASAGEEGWEELPSEPCGVGSLRRI